MKLFGNRLRLDRQTERTTIRWSRLNSFDLIVAFMFPLSCIWGIASARGMEEVWGMDVRPMNTPATLIFWSATALMLLHVLFNRQVSLAIGPDHLTYRKRAFPPSAQTITLQSISTIKVEEKDDPIAESSNNITPTNCKLTILSGMARPIKIRGLSMEDMLTVRDEIHERM